MEERLYPADFKTFLHGDDLDKAIESVQVVREPLIEGFLYKKSAQMVFAPDGVGKSVVTIQACMQATVENAKVFNHFHVPKAVRTLYFQNERSKDEALERLKFMKKKTAFDSKNFVLDVGLQGMNLQEPKHFAQALTHVSEVVHSTMQGVDLIVLDPLYPLVGGDLTSNADVSPITNFSRILQNIFDCSILMVHHTNRGTYDIGEGKRVGRDMFGSVFLSAHCTGTYSLNVNDDESGSVLDCKKSAQKNLEKKIKLVFDPESFLSYYADEERITKKDRLYNFLDTCKATKKTFTFDDMQQACQLSPSKLRGQLENLKSQLKTVSILKHGKILYEML